MDLWTALKGIFSKLKFFASIYSSKIQKLSYLLGYNPLKALDKPVLFGYNLLKTGENA
jgi:hypothetical protein